MSGMFAAKGPIRVYGYGRGRAFTKTNWEAGLVRGIDYAYFLNVTFAI